MERRSSSKRIYKTHIETTMARLPSFQVKPKEKCGVCGEQTTWKTGGIGWGACCREKMVACINEWIGREAIKKGVVPF